MSLRTKMALGVTFIVVLLTGGFTYQSVRRQTETMNNELLSRGQTLLANASRSGRIDLKLGDVDRFRQRLPLLLEEPDVVYVLLLDGEGKPMLWEGALGEPDTADPEWTAAREYAESVPAFPEPGPSRTFHANLLTVRGEKVYQLSSALIVLTEMAAELDPLAPPTERLTKLGTLHVGLSTARTDAAIEVMIFRSLSIGMVVLVASLLLLAFVIEVVVRPIRAMTEAADLIAAGNLSQRIGLRGHDEIARLAGSFDKMTENLAASRKDLVEANEELRKWSGKLEQEVENRTEELKESNRDLEMAIAVKEDFLRAVSHDLNGPLVNISGMCGMILRKYSDQLDEGVRDRLSRILRNVGKLSDLIGDLLELSRIKSRRLPFTWVDISDLINEIWGFFEYQVEQKGFTLEIPERLPRIRAEKSRIRQIFHNLFDNAIKYAGDGDAPKIRVEYREEESVHRFEVRDNGPGILPEDRGILFHIFRRGKTPQVRENPGRGVGLTLVKQIVETYGGRVEVESEPGKGTTFHFTLGKRECSGEGADGAEEDKNTAR